MVWKDTINVGYVMSHQCIRFSNSFPIPSTFLGADGFKASEKELSHFVEYLLCGDLINPPGFTEHFEFRLPIMFSSISFRIHIPNSLLKSASF